MTFTVLSVVVLFLFVTITCIEIYKGIKRGFLLSLINLGNIAVSLLLSFAVTSLISKILAGTLIRPLRSLPEYQSIIQDLVSLDALVFAVAEMLIGAILFLLVFVVLRMLLFRIFRGIYDRRTKMQDDDPGYGREDHSCSTRLSKQRGAVCGGVAAVLVTMITVSPLMGTLELAGNVLSVVGNISTQAIESVGKGNVQLVNKFSDDLAGNVLYRLGGRWIYNNAASANLASRRVYLLSEMEVVEEISGDMLKIHEILQNPQGATQEHIDALHGLRSGLQKTVACEQLVGEAIRKCATAWKEGNSFFGMRRPALNSMVDPIFLDVLDVCSKTTSASAKRNADTILEVYAILLESGLFTSDPSDYNQILSLLARNQTMDQIDQAIAKNPYMADIDVASIMLKAFSSYIQNLQLTEQEYADFVQNIAFAINSVNDLEGLPQIEKVWQLTSYTGEYFSEIGLDIHPEVTEMISSELLKEFSDTDATAARIKFIFEKYKNG